MLLDITIKLIKDKESFWKEYDTLISSFITIVLFILAYFINQYLENRSNKKKSLEKLNYFTSIIISSLKLIKKQKTQIEENIQRYIEGDNYTFNTINLYSFLVITRVTEKLDLESYYLSYIGKYGNTPEIINEFQILIETFDFLNDHHKNFRDLIERGLRNHENRYIQFNPYIQRIDSSIGEVLKILHQSNFIKLKEFQEIVNKYYLSKYPEANDFPITYCENNLLIPLNTLLTHNITPDTNNVLLDFYNLIGETLLLLSDIRIGLVKLYVDINKSVDSLNLAEQKLTTNSEKLRRDLIGLKKGRQHFIWLRGIVFQ